MMVLTQKLIFWHKQINVLKFIDLQIPELQKDYVTYAVKLILVVNLDVQVWKSEVNADSPRKAS